MNQYKVIFIGLFLTILHVTGVTPVYAEGKIAGDTAMLVQSSVTNATSNDERVKKLKLFFESKQSPFANSAEHFINEADRLEIDWKLIPAIAGNESYFGQHIPANSFNAWGWAVFTGMRDGRHFASWEDGITVVSEGIKHNYIDKGAIAIEQIGRKYAADPRWAAKVSFFMKQIDEYSPQTSNELELML